MFQRVPRMDAIYRGSFERQRMHVSHNIDLGSWFDIDTDPAGEFMERTSYVKTNQYSIPLIDALAAINIRTFNPFCKIWHKKPGAARRRSWFACQQVEVFGHACFIIHSVETDFGRVIAVPRARLMTSCASIPLARETLNSTV